MWALLESCKFSWASWHGQFLWSQNLIGQPNILAAMRLWSNSVSGGRWARRQIHLSSHRNKPFHPSSRQLSYFTLALLAHTPRPSDLSWSVSPNSSHPASFSLLLTLPHSPARWCWAMAFGPHQSCGCSRRWGLHIEKVREYDTLWQIVRVSEAEGGSVLMSISHSKDNSQLYCDINRILTQMGTTYLRSAPGDQGGMKIRRTWKY